MINCLLDNRSGRSEKSAQLRLRTSETFSRSLGAMMQIPLLQPSKLDASIFSSSPDGGKKRSQHIWPDSRTTHHDFRHVQKWMLRFDFCQSVHVKDILLSE